MMLLLLTTTMMLPMMMCLWPLPFVLGGGSGLAGQQHQGLSRRFDVSVLYLCEVSRSLFWRLSVSGAVLPGVAP